MIREKITLTKLNDRKNVYLNIYEGYDNPLQLISVVEEKGLNKEYLVIVNSSPT